MRCALRVAKDFSKLCGRLQIRGLILRLDDHVFDRMGQFCSRQNLHHPFAITRLRKAARCFPQPFSATIVNRLFEARLCAC